MKSVARTVSKSLLAASFIIFISSCNSSSGSNGGGTPPKQTALLPAEVDPNQLDSIEQSTETLSVQDEAIVNSTFTDIGRVTYLNMQSQKQNAQANNQTSTAAPKVFAQALRDHSLLMLTTMTQNPAAPKEPDFYEQDQLAQKILVALNQKQICNPTLTENKTDKSQSISFSTSGNQCPMIISTELNALTIENPDQVNFDSKIGGEMKLLLNEQVLPELKNQDLLSAQLSLSAQLKMKAPTETDKTFNQSGRAQYSGSFVSRSLGPIEFSQTMIFAMSADFSQSPNQPNLPMTVRGVSQIELKAAGKRVVLTVKSDSALTPDTTCSLNRKSISLDKCHEIVKKLNMDMKQSSTTSSSSSSSTIVITPEN